MRRVASIAAFLALISAPARAQQMSTASDPPTIVTTGEATMTVAPDVAWVQMAVEGRAKKTADAQNAAAQGMTALQTALKSLNLAADAIRTTGYSLQEDWDVSNNQRTLRGFVARNTIEVRVDDLSKIGTVFDAAGSSGATSVSGLRYDVKNRATVELDLLKRAVADGLSRAGAIAAGARQTLGGIQRIQEQRLSAPVPMRAVSMEAAGGGRGGAGFGTLVTPGEIEIRAQVTLTVYLK
jgi:hypothetical protein